MKPIKDLSRREFIKISAYSGACLSLSVQLVSCGSTPRSNEAFSPNAWLNIYPDNRVVIAISKAEMGQGVMTSIPRIIAEELELDWSQIEIELDHTQGRFDSMYTGGSSSVRSLWQPLRIAGAAAKEMLIEAASLRWKIDIKDCHAHEGRIINQRTNDAFTYGELCQLASGLAAPQAPKVKNNKDYVLLGHEYSSLGLVSKVTGNAKYGIDTELENLKYAAIKHAPHFGSKLVAVNNPTQPLSPGIAGIVKLEGAVAVVANSYWLAQKTLNSLSIEWQDSPISEVNDHKISQDFHRLIADQGELVKEIGIKPSHTDQDIVSSQFECAYQAHATMEPMNCTAYIHKDGCDIWAPTQDADAAHGAANRALRSGIEYWGSKILQKMGMPSDIRIHPTLLGGGFGRRLEQDYVTEAVQIASQFDFPVKLLWSREEDIQHDYYRPRSMHSLKASIDKQGKITSWNHKCVGATKGKVAGLAIDYPYDIPHRSLHFIKKNHGIPIGYWRSISFSHNTFVTECFIDEIVTQTNQDPISFRRSMLGDNDRADALLMAIGEFSNWERKKKAGRHLGIAFSHCFGSYIATVAEIETSGSDVFVSEIFCTVDCGLVIDPNSVRAQMEGGILFGLNATIGHSIHIENGRVKESNFDDYPLLRINETPNIYIELLKNDHKPGGVGEIGVPTVAPAIANAFHQATGKRQRNIPFKLN